MTVTTTDSARTMTMVRSDSTRITGRSTGRNRYSTRSLRFTGAILPDQRGSMPGHSTDHESSSTCG